MDNHLFIVARDQPDLCTYLRREFSAEETVQVILDRRQGRDRRSGRERRTVPRVAATDDRRRTDRRSRPTIDAQLRSLGYAMLRTG
jgi:hypothetical protein